MGRLVNKEGNRRRQGQSYVWPRPWPREENKCLYVLDLGQRLEYLLNALRRTHRHWEPALSDGSVHYPEGYGGPSQEALR